MRIRKRFPLSSLPFSDPQLSRSPVVQQHHTKPPQQGTTSSQPSDLPHQLLSPPADHQPMTGSERPSWVCSISTNEAQDVKHKELGGEEIEKERLGEEEKSNNDVRKGSILGAEVGGLVLPPSNSSSHQEIGRWCEKDKVVPLKKRKGSFVREKIAKSNKAKMKSKTNKKQGQQSSGDFQQEGKEIKEGIGKDTNVGKKNSSNIKRGGVLVEGSRCSRVNGRGWRCCQQTLIGYSLCEHHLGKGRLRSMTSVRNRAVVAPKKDAPKEPLSSFSTMVQEKEEEKILLSDDNDDYYDDDDDDYYDDEDEKEKPKKRMKIGMVKARSMSSLLGQTSNVVVVVDDEKSEAFEDK